MGDQHRSEQQQAAPERVLLPEPERPPLQRADPPRAVVGLACPPALRRRGTGDALGGQSVDPSTQEALQRPAGGRALDAGVRSSMESAMGADFGGVKVHTDSAAARLSRNVQATAFTHGSDIYFSQGTYQPDTAQGQHLLAHELTHVVQQQQGRDKGGVSASGAPTVGRADDPLEAEAEKVAEGVVGALRRQTRDCTCGQDHR